MTELTVLPAASSDRASATRILTAAFAHDEHTIGLLPTDHRDRRMRRLFELEVGEAFAAGGHVWLAVDATTGAALGVALWEAPGSKPPLWHQVAYSPAFARVYGNRVLDAIGTDNAAAAHRPKVPHWYLRDIGTTPEARGRGAGSALLRHRIADADASRTGIYLESSSRANVGYYQRSGFLERSLIPARGTSDLIGMWRPPASAPGPAPTQA